MKPTLLEEIQKFLEEAMATGSANVDMAVKWLFIPRKRLCASVSFRKICDHC
jgi:hypothetical protein